MRDFTRRVDVFDLLGEPKYDVSTPIGAYCWALFELELADAAGRAADGRAWGVEGDGGGVPFGRLKEALADRARRGDEEASRALLDAAGVRVPEVVVSLGEAVDVVDTSGVRGVALSAEDDELRSRAEALFAWVDEYKRSPFPDTSSLISALLDVSYDIICTLPPPEDLAVPEDTLTIEEIRALTLEEVEALTLEQLRKMDLDAALDELFILDKLPLELEFAWAEKSIIKLRDYIISRCCYSLTVEELVERLTTENVEEGSEEYDYFVTNENDPSFPLGAYCWAIREVSRSFSSVYLGRSSETFVDLYRVRREELVVRAEMGDAAAVDALRGIPSEAPLAYPFAEAIEAVDDPRIRGAAFGAEDSVLLDAVGVFYGLVDEYRQAEIPSLYVFMVDLWDYIAPNLFWDPWRDEDQDKKPENQTLNALLEECEPPGGGWSD